MNPLGILKLAGGGASTLACLGAVLTLGGGAWALAHEHDVRVRAEVYAQQAVTAAQVQAAQDQRTIAGLNAKAAQAEARASLTASLKGLIHATPPSSVCGSSGPMRALVVGLRHEAASTAPTSPPAPGQRVGLPSAARTPR